MPPATIQRRLILGASSAIAERTARLFAIRGDALYLVARDAEKLSAIAADLKARGADRVETLAADLNETARHGEIIDDCVAKLGGVDTALIAHGLLGDQAVCERDFTAAELVIRTNFTSAVSLSLRIADLFEKRHGGVLAVIGSVAGDRGRAKNGVYGASKGGLALFLQALRQRLSRCGAHVLTVKPGFVDTPMTAGLAKNALFADPEMIANGIVKAIDRKKNVVYLPGYWRTVMWAVRTIPEGIFKKMSF